MSLSFHSPSSSALRGKRPARTKCQLDHGRERLEQRRGLLQQVALAMRIHCRVLVLALCLGLFLLLYFLGGNTADEPLLKQVVIVKQEEKRNSSPSPSELGRNVAAKFGAKKAPAQAQKEEKAVIKVANVKRLCKSRLKVGDSVEIKPIKTLHEERDLCVLSETMLWRVCSAQIRQMGWNGPQEG
ncbi:hypothetical protein WMY93_012119 [Mugilogobius chulae]|uniref:Uncharacterized protein n=1 Tax=Mugilogobius chulae TaxID=88201 RepID=A0AAW0PGP3_9GOBI